MLIICVTCCIRKSKPSGSLDVTRDEERKVEEIEMANKPVDNGDMKGKELDDKTSQDTLRARTNPYVAFNPGELTVEVEVENLVVKVVRGQGRMKQVAV